MTKIYIVRHPQYSNPLSIIPGRLPVELSEIGLSEAEKLKNFFHDKSINKIYSSPILRCKQTAEIISGNQIPVEYDDRLIEVLTAYQGFWNVDITEFFDKDGNPKLGGETDKEVQNRVVDFITNTKFEDQKNYIITTHGDPIYFFYCYVNKLPLPEPRKIMQNTHLVIRDYPPKGSITVINKEGSNFEVEAIIPPESL